MRYYIIAGEQSGDLHGSNLIKGLLQSDPAAEIRFWGGDKMAAVAGRPVKHIRDLAFMGFIEVLKHLPTILRNISFCKRDILDFKPDAVILIDYPGFNFRLFPFLKLQKIKTIYYISPQLWAWKKGRVKQMREFVDRLYVIFPFEVNFYKAHGIEAHYFGHPILDEINISDHTEKEKKTIAILPGSRKQEISYLLPEYIKVVRHFPNHKFIIAGMSAHGKQFYQQFFNEPNVSVAMDDTYGVLKKSYAALVTSGTATLETALHRVPQIVSYKGNFISYQIAKFLIKGIDYICIVNLIANKAVVKELIQFDVNEEMLKAELEKLLTDVEQKCILADYDYVATLLGQKGSSQKVANDMVSFLHTTQ
jgi:lipid-A-disaccharide synthase